MMCLTHVGVDCCGGFTESCSIFPSLHENGTAFGAVVSFVTVVHVVRRFDYATAPTTTAVTARTTAFLAVLVESLVGGPRVCLLRGCPINPFPILWLSTTVRINVVHWLGIDALVFIVARS
jgi:hypothetical protein